MKQSSVNSRGCFFHTHFTACLADNKQGGAEYEDWLDKKEQRRKDVNMKLQGLKDIIGEAYTDDMDSAAAQAASGSNPVYRKKVPTRR